MSILYRAKTVGKRLSIHSSKGLEFANVIIAGVNYLSSDMHGIRSGEMKLLYVAMTRATDRLLLTSSRQNSVTAQLQNVLSGVQGVPEVTEHCSALA
jgi:superfamily I DNA/RNA helicase